MDRTFELKFGNRLPTGAQVVSSASQVPASTSIPSLPISYGIVVFPAFEAIDVLGVPGGIGTIAPDRNTTALCIRKTFQKLRYFITVCTGAHLAAGAGVLDDRNTTAMKGRQWQSKVATLGRNTTWIAPARWTSGTTGSAGIDAAFAYISSVYGESVTVDLAISMEYEGETD
ncbi:ThiJ/PfpI family protein [Xylariales sp. AK1849]|nr:ThiJ/PfpI family protein [Xylariales sp. AK1849]